VFLIMTGFPLNGRGIFLFRVCPSGGKESTLAHDLRKINAYRRSTRWAMKDDDIRLDGNLPFCQEKLSAASRASKDTFHGSGRKQNE